MVDSSLSKFVDLMSKEESEVKLSAIKLIPKIVNEMNSDKLFNEFLPYVLNCIDDEEESLISEVLSIIPTIIPIQGNKANTHKLLPFVELGLISYNSKVREEALTTYKIILKECISANKDFDVYEFVQKLSNSINQKYRIAFLLVIPTVYKHFNTNQKARIFAFLKQFSYEGNEYVKKMLASNLKDLCFFITEDVFTVICNNLLECTNDNIRIHLIGSIVSLKYNQNLNLFQPQIQKMITAIGKDESWRVRYTFVTSVHDLLSFSIISPNLKKEIVVNYAQMFLDKEEEVRSMSITNLGPSLEKLKDDPESMNILMDSFEKAVNIETSPIVKDTISESIVSISKNVPKNKVKTVVIPICYELLKSYNKDDGLMTPQNNKSNFSLSPIGDKKKLMQSTSPLISKNSISRQKLHESLLESYLGKINIDKSKKSSQVIIYDNSGNCGIYTHVQLKTLKNIPMIQKNTQHNFENIVITSIIAIFNNSRWKNKVKLLDTINELIGYFSPLALSTDILDLLLRGLQENVYSIRESAIQSLVEVLVKVHNDEVNAKVAKVLSTLKGSSNYQMRKCGALFIYSYVKKKNTNENFINNQVIPIISSLVKDKVKNIRAVCGLIIANLIQKNKAYSSKFSKVIEEYSNDTDEEVKKSIVV